MLMMSDTLLRVLEPYTYASTFDSAYCPGDRIVNPWQYCHRGLLMLCLCLWPPPSSVALGPSPLMHSQTALVFAVA